MERITGVSILHPYFGKEVCIKMAHTDKQTGYHTYWCTILDVLAGGFEVDHNDKKIFLPFAGMGSVDLLESILD